MCAVLTDKLWLRFAKTICGGVSEWSKEHAWKVCKSQGFEGSNPSPSATNID